MFCLINDPNNFSSKNLLLGCMCVCVFRFHKKSSWFVHRPCLTTVAKFNIDHENGPDSGCFFKKSPKLGFVEIRRCSLRIMYYGKSPFFTSICWENMFGMLGHFFQASNKQIQVNKFHTSFF